jgi:ligand-binding sensor domain-containing protein
MTDQNPEEQANSLELGTPVGQLDENIWSVFQDSKQNYWFGSNGNGLYRFDGKNLIQYTDKDGLINNSIRGIQGDHLGNVFIQTPHGISKFDGNAFTTLNLITSPKNEWKSERNDLWFNCSRRANDVYRYDGESLYELKLPRKDLDKAFKTEVTGLSFEDSNNSPYSVFGINKDKDGNLWFGTVVAGVYHYDGTSFLWIPEKELSRLPDGRVPGVRSMIQDKNGFYWLSNFKSKYKITTSDSTTTYEKFEGISNVNTIFEDELPYFNSGVASENGDLWMTTYSSDIWKYVGEELLKFQVIDGNTDVSVLAIYQDNQGVIWVGTRNTEIFKFNGTSFDKFNPPVKKN